jgi:hypothetical protein
MVRPMLYPALTAFTRACLFLQLDNRSVVESCVSSESRHDSRSVVLDFSNYDFPEVLLWLLN